MRLPRNFLNIFNYGKKLVSLNINNNNNNNYHYLVNKIYSNKSFQTANRYFFTSTFNYNIKHRLQTLNNSSVNITETIKSKNKLLRKKKKSSEKFTPDGRKTLNITAFCTAEEYNLENLSENLNKQGLYEIQILPDDIVDDLIYVRSKYEVDKISKEIYFFRDGTVIFWNVSDLERETIFNYLKPFEIKPYEDEIIREEAEEMDYEYINTNTRFSKGRILLEANNENLELQKYAFSNALSLSVKLAIWESSLDKYVDSIKWITEDMKYGERIKLTRNDVFRKTGELFTLKHHINLSSDLLDTPDFYWDREKLENLFHETCSLLNIAKRTRVMNEKLNHCCELMELLSHHLSDKHHIRLEWMIIVLIMVEVFFEIIHYVEKDNATEAIYVDSSK